VVNKKSGRVQTPPFFFEQKLTLGASAGVIALVSGLTIEHFAGVRSDNTTNFRFAAQFLAGLSRK
jgi:hypothetical protein